LPSLKRSTSFISLSPVESSPFSFLGFLINHS
jgi:hypothetical protein